LHAGHGTKLRIAAAHLFNYLHNRTFYLQTRFFLPVICLQTKKGYWQIFVSRGLKKAKVCANVFYEIHCYASCLLLSLYRNCTKGGLEKAFFPAAG
jgi:hypothetical protein